MWKRFRFGDATWRLSRGGGAEELHGDQQSGLSWRPAVTSRRPASFAPFPEWWTKLARQLPERCDFMVALNCMRKVSSPSDDETTPPIISTLHRLILMVYSTERLAEMAMYFVERPDYQDAPNGLDERDDKD